MIIIQGEMGSGKSRLALDLLKHKEKGLYLLLDKDHSVLQKLKKQKIMLIFILISVYILSIIGCKYVYLLQSSRYLDNFKLLNTIPIFGINIPTNKYKYAFKLYFFLFY